MRIWRLSSESHLTSSPTSLPTSAGKEAGLFCLGRARLLPASHTRNVEKSADDGVFVRLVIRFFAPCESLAAPY